MINLDLGTFWNIPNFGYFTTLLDLLTLIHFGMIALHLSVIIGNLNSIKKYQIMKSVFQTLMHSKENKKSMFYKLILNLCNLWCNLIFSTFFFLILITTRYIYFMAINRVRFPNLKDLDLESTVTWFNLPKTT